MRKPRTVWAMLIALAIACVVPAAHAAGTPAPARYAWLSDGVAHLWTLDAPQAGAGAPLPDTLQTPLGSIWKLFVYAYLVDRNSGAPDYDGGGGDKD